MTALFDSAPGFDQPIAVLKHCHDRIRKQLSTLDKLLQHLPQHGADADACQAAAAVLKYFDTAAHNHHADEEEDLLPMLESTAVAEDAALLKQLMPRLLDEHREMETAWTVLRPQLQAIADGSGSELSADAVRSFAAMYAGHMETEEGHIAPMAKRLFSERQMAALGQAMQARRGINSSQG
ncbi:Hemerythrin-like domain-containing protein [Noviherbaspirillum humi]|uniref:Hemerythrin-like domain-containing protein n=1 Tax=Noviherbaspirillum humi TaxID=1688639 RepID=A0A239E2F4_9BURK|nr:hemerythrin domain-containing protein [Noviherbaspirillum humi]SNS38153.1 Hemerythrin-like domain-containing protein [Noviherbaspirillum humi]